MACGNGKIGRKSLSSAPRTTRKIREGLLAPVRTGVLAQQPQHKPRVAPKAPPPPRINKEWAARGGRSLAEINRTLANPPASSTVERSIHLDKAPTSKNWGEKELRGDEKKQMYYSRVEVPASGESTIEYFVGPDKTPTFQPERHVHVIHHEVPSKPGEKEGIHNWVEIVLTDKTQQQRSDRHPIHVTLINNPSGQEVNDQVNALIDIMNAHPRGAGKVPPL